MKPKIAGIVVEYNPFHNGHIHHINETRRITNCDVLIAIMSPNFVQRGEPAFINKWERTRTALEHGVDLVIELPTYYAVQSADHFATAAITLLKLADIDTLVYGAESLNIETKQFNQTMMDEGKSYPAANNSDSPNNILAEAYEKQVEGKEIKTIRIQRTNQYHDTDINQPISSASAIRKAHKEQINLSHTTPMTFDKIQTHTLEDYLPFIQYELTSKTNQELSSINLMSEGIENLLIKNRHINIIESSINKRYTRSRIQRTLMNVYLHLQKDEAASLTQFRVLGMNTTGRKHLSTLDTDLYTSQFKNYINKDMELKASELYALPYSEEYQKATHQNEIQNVIIIK